MFDTHVNLHADAFAEDLDDVLSRARAAGVRRFLAICDKFSNAERVLEIATAHDDIWCTVGAHPHHAKDHESLTVRDLASFAQNPNVVAIGETGMDQHYGYSDIVQQEACFRTHIAAAQEAGLPVIIHTREADDLTARILEEMYAVEPFSMLLHCYTGGADLAARGLNLGAFVSVSGILSFKNATDVRAVIKGVPLDRLIVETDCPYLAPVPMRGRRNEPAFLPHVIAALAELKGCDTDHIARVTEENALRLFSRISE